jgi:integrase/recombinase XerD
MAVADARSAAPTSAEPFEHLVLDFLAYLEFELGLSRNTL